MKYSGRVGDLDLLASESEFFINCLNGIFWENLERRTIQDYVKDEGGIPESWYEKALFQARELESLSLPIYKKRPYSEEFGWGSYKWKGDPDIPLFALENNILIDTGETYGFGKVEAKLSKIVKSGEYSDLHKPRIYTKIAKNRMSRDSISRYWDRENDKFGNFVAQIHWPSNKFDIREVWDEFSCHRLSRIRAPISFPNITTIGLCNVSLYQIIKLSRAFRYSNERPHSIQVRININDFSFLPLIKYIPPTVRILGHSTLSQGLNNLRKTGAFDKLLNLSVKAPAQRVPIPVLIPSWVRSYGVIPLIGSNRLSNVVEQKNYSGYKLSPGIIKEIEETFKPQYGLVKLI